MSLIEARDLRTAKDVFQNRKNVREYFTNLKAPPLQQENERLRKELTAVKAERDNYRALYARSLETLKVLDAEPETITSDPGRVTLKGIIVAVCEHYGLRRIELLSERKARAIVVPRFVAMWLARKHTTNSLPTIGRIFGGRHHTTVMHATSYIDEEMQTDQEMRSTIESIEQKLSPAGDNQAEHVNCARS